MPLLQEWVDSRGVRLRVEREPAVIRGVKILGLKSRNGRSYSPQALAQAAGLYEGAKVNVNHPKGDPSGPRDYQDRIGVIREVVVRPEDGLFADFHFNPRHALAEQLLWDAEHAPENVGFSHSVQARLARRGEETVVEEILHVQSVDLVADPATTCGLFEASAETAASDLAAMTIDQIREQRPDLIEKLVAEAAAGNADELRHLRDELDRLRAEDASRRRREQIRQMLREFALPDPDSGDAWAKTAVSPRFLDQLLAAPDEQAMRELVEERARLIAASQQSLGHASPVSRDPHQIHPPLFDAKAFAEAIT